MITAEHIRFSNHILVYTYKSERHSIVIYFYVLFLYDVNRILNMADSHSAMKGIDSLLDRYLGTQGGTLQR